LLLNKLNKAWLLQFTQTEMSHAKQRSDCITKPDWRLITWFCQIHVLSL